MKPIVSSCSYNTSVFKTPYVNKLIRTGNVVEITFQAQINAQPSGNTNIIIDLPTAAKGSDAPILSFVSDVRYALGSGSSTKQCWVFDAKNIRTDNGLLVADKWFYVNYIYITTD